MTYTELKARDEKLTETMPGKIDKETAKRKCTCGLTAKKKVDKAAAAAAATTTRTETGPSAHEVTRTAASESVMSHSPSLRGWMDGKKKKNPQRHGSPR